MATPTKPLRMEVEHYSTMEGARFYRIEINFRSRTKQRAAGGVKTVNTITGKEEWRTRHHTKEYNTYRKSFQDCISLAKLKPFTGMVWMAIGFVFSSTPPGDGDNYEGWVMDACQGVLYPNDRRVWVGMKQRFTKSDEDHIIIFIGDAEEVASERGNIIVPTWRKAWVIVSQTFGISTSDSG